MPFKRKHRILAGLLLLTLILSNIICLGVAASQPIFTPSQPRKSAEYGTVPISTSGTTEHLGYIDDGDISLHWFVHMTDIHFVKEAYMEFIPTYANFLNWSYETLHPFTFIVTGDLIIGQQHQSYESIGDNAIVEYGNYFGVVNASKYATDPNPYRYIETAGNHDRNADWDIAYYMNNTLAGQRLGTVQTFFSANFSHGKVLYAILDSTPYEATPKLFGSEGSLDETDLTEYRTFLQENPNAEHIMTFQHQHPLDTFGQYNGNPWGEIAINKEFNTDAVFYGHTHMNFMETWEDQVWIMGAKWKDTYDDNMKYYYNLVAIDGGGMTYAPQSFNHLPHILITNPTNPVFLDDADSVTDTRGDGHVRTIIFANESDPVSTVSYSLDGGSWEPMQKYKGSSAMIYESNRGTIDAPLTAIPADGQPHKVEVKVVLQSSKEFIESANVGYAPTRKVYFQGILLGLGAGFLGIVAVINRDNYPLKRPEGKRRRLTHQEKVQKRQKKNQDRNKPAYLSILGVAFLLNYLLMPLGIFPIIQGTWAVAYTFWIYSPTTGFFFLIEPILFSVGRLILISPFLYWGVRTYHPEAVNTAGWLMIINTLFLIGTCFAYFGMAGLILPGVYFEGLIGLGIVIVNWKHTFAYRTLRKVFGRK